MSNHHTYQRKHNKMMRLHKYYSHKYNYPSMDLWYNFMHTILEVGTRFNYTTNMRTIEKCSIMFN